MRVSIMGLACVVLVALAGCAAQRAEAPAPPSKMLWRVYCDADGAIVQINIGTTGPGVWTLSGDELACTHHVPTT